MANFLSGFLNNLESGTGSSKGNLGDYAHASRLYTSDSFSLAPKTKFLYHVVFNFHPNALNNAASFKQQHRTTVGLLVKEVELPKFKINVDTVQQYNRKKQIHTRLDYEPVTLKFHDDNSGVTTQLWSTYYGYYFADSKHGGSAGTVGPGPLGLANFLSNAIPGVGKFLGIPKGTSGTTPTTIPEYQRNSYKNLVSTVNYGLDNQSMAPFFTSIQIFQLSRHQYQSFTLVNPVITAWQHDAMDNSSSEPAANTMTIAYEAVIYGQGSVSEDNPAGFAVRYYDKTPSPINLAAGQVGLFGSNGILSGASGLLDSILTGKAFSSPRALLGTVINGATLLKNAKSLTSEGIRKEGFGLIKGAITAVTGYELGGVNNVSFPKNSAQGTAQILPATIARPTVSNGPVEQTKVQDFFNSRPGALSAMAKNTVFQKEIGVGNLTEINNKWNSLSPLARAEYERKALDAIANGAPEVQHVYNQLKTKG